MFCIREDLDAGSWHVVQDISQSSVWVSDPFNSIAEARAAKEAMEAAAALRHDTLSRAFGTLSDVADAAVDRRDARIAELEAAISAANEQGA